MAASDDAVRVELSLLPSCDGQTLGADAVDPLDLLARHRVREGMELCIPVMEIDQWGKQDRILRGLRAVCDKHGILLILDEVQSGFGRTAEWFASEHYAVDPDIIAMGKGIANGLPLSAFGASKELMDSWPLGSHGTTYGGNPISCAASAATIEALEDVVPQVPKLSDHAFDRWNELKDEFRTIGDVRGLGLMIGVELVGEGRTPAPEAFAAVASYAKDNGIPVGPGRGSSLSL